MIELSYLATLMGSIVLAALKISCGLYALMMFHKLEPRPAWAFMGVGFMVIGICHVLEAVTLNLNSDKLMTSLILQVFIPIASAIFILVGIRQMLKVLRKYRSGTDRYFKVMQKRAS